MEKLWCVVEVPVDSLELRFRSSIHFLNCISLRHPDEQVKVAVDGMRFWMEIRFTPLNPLWTRALLAPGELYALDPLRFTRQQIASMTLTQLSFYMEL